MTDSYTKKPILALDVDSTLSDTMVRWCESYNKSHGASLTKNDIIDWNITDYLPLTYDEMMTIFTEIWVNWRTMPTTEPNIGQIVQQLKDEKQVRITIITKRRADSITPVVDWLNYHKIPYDDLICMLDNRPKAEFVFRYLIDDAFHYLDAVRGIGQRGIMINQPWNKKYEFTYRIDKLSDLLNGKSHYLELA